LHNKIISKFLIARKKPEKPYPKSDENPGDDNFYNILIYAKKVTQGINYRLIGRRSERFSNSLPLDNFSSFIFFVPAAQ